MWECDSEALLQAVRFWDVGERSLFWDVEERSLFGDVENRELIISISTS
ncbi:hypothetical protein PN471_20090 [Aphanizomenon sp. CS-733/32]|nr:hypothetical protein [Aphanizomenon sp. CS-733/32]MDB9310883.1 hypothetical protein [Aphanizomenon sp. CS-733/32]